MQQNTGQSRPLHAAFPRLAGKLPHVTIATLPTPLHRLEMDTLRLYVKQDAVTSALYGGNKVRKLEYLLAQAARHDCRRVATLGTAGSNHATATALHARALGLECISFLSRQRPTRWLARNLRAQLDAGARIVYVGGDRQAVARTVHETLQRASGNTWLIPMGGSSCTGAIGYVNAGFELAAQIDAGEMPTPDAIYVPLGTMGTAVGLCIGLRAAGIGAPLIAVRVVHESVGSRTRARRFFERTAGLLARMDPDFPRIDAAAAGFRVRDEQFGPGYAHATEGAREALRHAREHWQLELETTYSAKALAALLGDSRRGELDGKTVLYWNTYSATPPPPATGAPDLDALPAELRGYLTGDEPAPE